MGQKKECRDRQASAGRPPLRLRDWWPWMRIHFYGTPLGVRRQPMVATHALNQCHSPPTAGASQDAEHPPAAPETAAHITEKLCSGIISNGGRVRLLCWRWSARAEAHQTMRSAVRKLRDGRTGVF